LHGFSSPVSYPHPLASTYIDVLMIYWLSCARILRIYNASSCSVTLGLGLGA
jgi:hypothetical protein